MDLLTVLAACTFASGAASSPVTPDLMYSVVYETSEAREWYLEDVSTGQAHLPPSRAAAVRLASTLRDQGHEVHIGLAGVRVELVRSHGMSLEQAFDPCTNVKLASSAIAAEARTCGGLGCGLRGYWSPTATRSASGWAAAVRQRKRVDVDAALANPTSSVPNPTYATSPQLLLEPRSPGTATGGDMLVAPPSSGSSEEGTLPEAGPSSGEGSASEESSPSSSKDRSRSESSKTPQEDVTDEKLHLDASPDSE
jgi:type IV secretion system protein VirB1